MLKNVVAAYLASVRRERDFDAAFLALLQAMGYRDVHLTHGTNEKGKDFIAKSPDGKEQWAFQSKKGDINLTVWRSDVYVQLLECATTPLQHPAFDAGLPRVTVLVATGFLKQEANDRADGLAENLERTGQGRLEVWAAPQLAELLLEHGLEGLRGTDADDVEAFGRFLELYGQAVRREVTAQDLEIHSQTWVRATEELPRRKLVAALETAILSERLSLSCALYEAAQVELCGLRAAMVWLFRAATYAERADATGLHRAQLARVVAAHEAFVRAAVEARRETQGRLDLAVGGAMAMVTYPVACARLMEACGLLALLSSGEVRERNLELLGDIVRDEPGCWHPISDKFAVSLVLAAVALGRFGRREEAVLLLEQTAVWVADRHDEQGGVGLAGVDDPIETEIERFLGWPFDFLNVARENGSLVATAVIDMAAALGLSELYADVVNDLKAVGVCPQYYQVPDTESQFFVEGEDVVSYSNSEVDDELLRPDALDYADHARREPERYRLVPEVGAESYIALASLLRDRWFLALIRNLLRDI